ncbi:GRIP domain-containing protein RUD3-like [Actinia tenebrosa]|uniref:GRIP domain-containing protein RUD3-like n=1 Tax=Actinia tenebrosa TaxID=6105 RepID=A0A6P8IZW6_ACTTE|nr:GRIP domain-containing protein RUD3-like [Actinia tenebrosa]
MEVDETTDFDPTTEEGKEDINDGDEEPLLPAPDDSLRNSITKALRHPKAREYVLTREHIELEDLGTVNSAMQRLKDTYSNFNSDEVRLTERGGRVLISVQDLRFPDKNHWTKPQLLFDENGEVRGDVARLRGFQLATRSALERLATLNERVALEKHVEGLQETLEEREADYMRQNQLLLDAQKREVNDKNQQIIEMREQRDDALRKKNLAQKAFNLALQDLDMSKEEAKNLHTTIAGSLEERRQLVAEINTKEEQIRQRDQAIEELEGQIERQQEIINDQARPEEEREAAQREV